MGKTYKVYPSSAAFYVNGYVITEYSSGCFRKILLGQNGVREPFSNIYAHVGEINEERFERENCQDKNYIREKVIRRPVEGFESILYSGRIDFSIDGMPNELKSCTSKNTRLNVIRKGKIKLGPLAQISSYLAHENFDRGVLWTDYWEQNKKTEEWEHLEGVKHKIKIDTEGEIWYKAERTKFDKKKSAHKDFPTKPVHTGFNIKDQLKHTLKQAEMLSKQTIENRPVAPAGSFKTPCDFCVFSSACDKVDSKEICSTKDFIEEGKRIVERLE